MSSFLQCYNNEIRDIFNVQFQIKSHQWQENHIFAVFTIDGGMAGFTILSKWFCQFMNHKSQMYHDLQVHEQIFNFHEFTSDFFHFLFKRKKPNHERHWGGALKMYEKEDNLYEWMCPIWILKYKGEKNLREYGSWYNGWNLPTYDLLLCSWTNFPGDISKLSLIV